MIRQIMLVVISMLFVASNSSADDSFGCNDMECTVSGYSFAVEGDRIFLSPDETSLDGLTCRPILIENNQYFILDASRNNKLVLAIYDALVESRGKSNVILRFSAEHEDCTVESITFLLSSAIPKES